MTFLPIVQRELRQAARRRSTFRIRWWTTLAAMAICLMGLAFGSVGPNRTSGASLFNLLTHYAFGLCLLTGIFLTADALSEERREGTLGLLFLTDLKGYDVVLGKFMAIALRALYGLLALLPVTAMPLLVGGVTGGEVWRMALAQLNALFFSLAAGIFVSAFSRDSQRAVFSTFGLLLLAVGGLPGLAFVAGHLRIPAGWLLLSWFSPAYPFSLSWESLYVGHAGKFWGTLFASHVLGWTLLGVASLALPRIWQEKAAARPALAVRRRRWDPERSARLRARLLARNPVLWLRHDELGVPWAAWAVVVGWAATVLAAMLIGPIGPGASFLVYSARPFGFLLKALFAFQACQFFVDARRNGTLELLLCTPLTDREIISGQYQALWRSFGWPMVVFLLLAMSPGLESLLEALTQVSISPLARASFLGPFGIGLFAIRFVADLAAVCWVGMGAALTMKKPALAPALTVLLVLVLPSVLGFCWMDLLADLLFISWGRNKCQMALRPLLTRGYSPSPLTPARAPASEPASAPPITSP